MHRGHAGKGACWGFGAGPDTCMELRGEGVGGMGGRSSHLQMTQELREPRAATE